MERALTGDSLRWLPIETLETDDEEVIRTLDRECHVPRPTTVLITLEAHIVSGRLQLSAPLASPIRVQGDHIYLGDGRQLQIALASDPTPESQPG